jgi:hypothetical protein
MIDRKASKAPRPSQSPATTLKLIAGTGAALVATGWGCLSMQSQNTIDGGNNNLSSSNQPFVEAYIEYPGPQTKWAGPSSFILHVTAKDAGAAQITMTPDLPTGDKPAAPSHDATTSSHRAPAASALSAAAGARTTRKMTSEEARNQLAFLGNALQGAQAPFRGCMSPVRVRMIRADGGIFERQGCRSELGWSRAVSEAVSTFVDASIHGVTAPLPAAPAPAAPKAATPVQAAAPAAAPAPASAPATASVSAPAAAPASAPVAASAAHGGAVPAAAPKAVAAPAFAPPPSAAEQASVPATAPQAPAADTRLPASAPAAPKATQQDSSHSSPSKGPGGKAHH